MHGYVGSAAPVRRHGLVLLVLAVTHAGGAIKLTACAAGGAVLPARKARRGLRGADAGGRADRAAGGTPHREPPPRTHTCRP
jgi:hypothetical protein